MTATSQEKRRHTPGPWRVGERRGGGRIDVRSGPNTIATTNGWPETEANARLIVTAPELLQLAKRMLAAWEGSGPSIALDDIRELIAKAEGRS